MTDHDGLLNRQADRHDRATRLLHDLDILGRWRRHGQPYLCGAYAYQLLVAPDIDIEIFGQLTPDAGFAVAAALAHAPVIRKITYINAVDAEDAGLGWEAVAADATGARWTIQMWLLPTDYPGPRSTDLIQPMLARLDQQQRRVILAIKEHLVAARTPYRSIDIYRAVLDHNVATVDDYHQWVSRSSSTGLSLWKP